MSASLSKPQRQEQIDINFKCETTCTSDLHSAALCGCKSACEPILNMDGTIVTTCSSRGEETANHFRLNSVTSNNRPKSMNMDQTNTGFANDENTFDRAFRSHGNNQMSYLILVIESVLMFSK